MIAPLIAIAETLMIDHLDVRTKILTRITIGIKARISVGQPKKLLRNEFIYKMFLSANKAYEQAKVWQLHLLNSRLHHN